MPEKPPPAEVKHVAVGDRQEAASVAAEAALAAVPGARVAMLVLIFDADEGDPPGLLPTQFVAATRPGKDVAVSYAVDTLREHATALENYDRQRVAGAASDKGRPS